MKKLNVLLIVSMLAVALLAANPPGKLVRLEIINNSGDTVYMKLEGRGTGAFYYLTVQKATDKFFTVLVDSYKRTTWACGGITTKGSLVMTGNVKLNFVQCGKFPTRVVWIDINGNGINDGYTDLGICWPYFPYGACTEMNRRPSFGEPTQEKVVYFQTYTNSMWVKVCRPGAYSIPGVPDCLFYDLVGATFKWHTIWAHVKTGFVYWGTVKFPVGRFMRYKY
jgi:hypothetical protein